MNSVSKVATTQFAFDRAEQQRHQLHTNRVGQGFQPQGNLLLDKNGDLLGATYSGGADEYGTIFRLTAKGTLTTLYTFTGGTDGGDPNGGLAQDSEGNLYVCDAGNGCVWVFDPHAVPLYRIRSCTEGRTLTNLAFGGEDNRQLFITDSSTGSILVADLPHSGQPMFSHR